ncbi:MAG: B12-binding domain-containing radical SAM protein [Planctomycetota bacterium]|jgi:radical SAM superfamily enzyme YgiQ (UPF0313 family)
MKIVGLIPSSQLVKNVVRDVIYGCWCSGKRIGGATVPPLTMLSALSYLRGRGHDVTLLDALAEQLAWLEIVDRAEGADVIILNSATMSIREDAELLELLKQRTTPVKTVVFGSHATFLPRSTLSFPAIDTIVMGEPEIALAGLMDRMRNGEPIDGLQGVATRDSGDLASIEHAPLLDMDEIPFLAVDMLPAGVEYYNPIVQKFPYVTMETSRGCPAGCRFCTAPRFFGQTVRAKSVDRVVDEIEFYLSQGYREVYFRDETFTFQRRRTREICQGMIDRGLTFPWIANARVGNLLAEDFALMKQAGCHYVKFGVESGVQEILDRAKKGIRVEQTVEDFRSARSAGIDTHGHFMLGMPGDTAETVEQTLAFTRNLAATTVSIGICTPFPGTPLFDDLLEQHPELADGVDADLAHEHCQSFFNEHYTDLSNEQLQSALRRGYRKFYLRWRYLAWRLTRLRGLAELRRVLIAGVNILSFSVSPQPKRKDS